MWSIAMKEVAKGKEKTDDKLYKRLDIEAREKDPY